MYCIYNFVDNIFFEQQPAKIIEKKIFKIICVGNIRPEKNFDLIFNAFCSGLKNNHAIELDIWGANRSAIDYQQQLEAEGVTNLHIKGPATNITELMPQYDLFVSSSKYESFGISVLEAMALRVPVLLSDIPAFKELYEGYATFFESESVPDFTYKLTEIIKAPERLSITKEKAFNYARQFSVLSTVNNLKTLYKKYGN